MRHSKVKLLKISCKYIGRIKASSRTIYFYFYEAYSGEIYGIINQLSLIYNKAVRDGVKDVG